MMNISKINEDKVKIYKKLTGTLRSHAMDADWRELYEQYGMVGLTATGSAGLALFPEYGILTDEKKITPYRSPGDFDVYPYVKEEYVLSGKPPKQDILGKAVIGMIEKAAKLAGYDTAVDEKAIHSSRLRAQSEGGSKDKVIIIDPKTGTPLEVSTRGNMPWKHFPAVSATSGQAVIANKPIDERILATNPLISFCDKIARAYVWDGEAKIEAGGQNKGTRKAKSGDPLDLYFMLRSGLIDPKDSATQKAIQMAFLLHEVHWGNYAKVLGNNFNHIREKLSDHYDVQKYVEALEKQKGIRISVDEAKEMFSEIRSAFLQIFNLPGINSPITVYTPRELRYLENVFSLNYNAILNGHSSEKRNKIKNPSVADVTDRISDVDVVQRIYGTNITQDFAKQDLFCRVQHSPHRMAVEKFAQQNAR